MTISHAEQEKYLETGFVVVESMFQPDEIQLLSEISRRDQEIEAGATARNDADGGKTILSVRDDLGEDIYSAIVRCGRVAGTIEALMGEEVYHYHHKLMLKEPRVGGAWEWHQDYGYWYDYGCLFPNMASCYIAIDRATQENGCLQVIPGSHRLGRIDHGKVGGQTGADPQRVQHILERMPHQHVQMQPGDALFFHGNLLHRSDQNRSPYPRWSLICCFNARSNSPYEVIRHNGYKTLEQLPDESVLEFGRRQWASIEKAI